MTPRKPFYQSKRFWGVAVMAVSDIMSYIPAVASFAPAVKEFGTFLFGLGVLTAKTPLSVS